MHGVAKPDPARFAELQAAVRAAEDTRGRYRADLRYDYQDPAYAPKSKRDKLDRLDRAQTRAWDRFFAYLTGISPRAWDRGIPVTWIVRELSYQDAITRDRLSVTPPASWGTDTRDREFQELIGEIR